MDNQSVPPTGTSNALEARLECMLATLRGEVAALRGEVAALRGEVGEVAALRGEVGEVAALQGEVAAIRGDITAIRIGMEISTARSKNSTALRDDTLALVPFPNGDLPSADQYPKSINQLVAADNNILLKGQKDDWNAKKSLDLIRQYEPDYSSSDSGSEDEVAQKQRARRLHNRLAAHLGVTFAQLKDAVESAWDF